MLEYGWALMARTSGCLGLLRGRLVAAHVAPHELAEQLVGAACCPRSDRRSRRAASPAAVWTGPLVVLLDGSGVELVGVGVEVAAVVAVFVIGGVVCCPSSPRFAAHTPPIDRSHRRGSRHRHQPATHPVARPAGGRARLVGGPAGWRRAGPGAARGARPWPAPGAGRRSTRSNSPGSKSGCRKSSRSLMMPPPSGRAGRRGHGGRGTSPSRPRCRGCRRSRPR